MKTNITLQSENYKNNGYGVHNYIAFFIDSDDIPQVKFFKSRKSAETFVYNEGSHYIVKTVKQAINEYPEHFC